MRLLAMLQYVLLDVCSDQSDTVLVTGLCLGLLLATLFFGAGLAITERRRR